ncbi:lysophospholipid acyltransferase family protein [Uliginosibacterium gangwonense]|uniref:lysophospholipid acyltransferase family protein n=1 Tax=Uliginosibacterium gangwonense TaxID=392736 RepID=UPI0003A698D6|nr:lysophospholipid acyltransferase family protein [Uliginosibacterium gangwonense]
MLKRFYEQLAIYLAWFLLGKGCLLWSAAAIPLRFLLPRKMRQHIGRVGISKGFRLYLWGLEVLGVCRFDLRELDALRDAGPLIIAPNHPCLLDALMVLSRLPNTACVLKAELIDNFFMGAGARLAGFIRNDWFVGMIRRAIAELEHGYQLLLFPEGTRSEGGRLQDFKASTAIIACRARVPIQTVIIETDSNFLGKGWPPFKRTNLPVHFSVRLGPRFQPGDDPIRLTAELQTYFARAMNGNASPETCANQSLEQPQARKAVAS